MSPSYRTPNPEPPPSTINHQPFTLTPHPPAPENTRAMSLADIHPTRTSKLDRRNAYMQHCSMTTLTMTKRGAITIPPDIRKRMGLDRLEHPLLIAEERDGGLFIQPAVATPIRDIPLEKIQAWLKEDEKAMNELRGTGPV